MNLVIDRLRGAWSDGGREWFHVCLDSPFGSILVNLLLERHGDAPLGVVTFMCLGAEPHAIQRRTRASIVSAAADRLEIGGARLRFLEDTIVLEVFERDVELRARLQPMSLATAPSSTHFGTGTLHWSVTPDCRVEGSVRVGSSRVSLGQRGYFDHNWGDFRWGREVGWEWAYAHLGEHALVWMRMLHRDSRASLGDALLLWTGGRIQRTWVGAQLRVCHGRAWQGRPRQTTPGLLRHLLPDRVSGVPETITVRTSLPAATLTLRTLDVARLVVPDDVDAGASVIHEIACVAELEGLPAGSITGHGVMEVVGAA